MKARLTTSIAVSFLLAGAAAFTGCKSSNATAARGEPSLSLRTDSDKTFVGEAVNVFTRTRNTLSSSTAFRWDAPGGTVKTEDDGRVAQVVFDKPGTYTINATLVVNHAAVAINARTELLYGRPAEERITSPEGCTGAIVLPEATAAGRLLHGQNWDWRDECLETGIILRISPEAGPRILSFTEAGLLGYRYQEYRVIHGK